MLLSEAGFQSADPCISYPLLAADLLHTFVNPEGMGTISL
jgi:hypothetical protein